jgi:CRP-like cAMP-binding protein
VVLQNEAAVSPQFLKNRLLAKIIAAEPDYLLPRLQVIEVPFNHTLYNEGDWITAVYFPINSLISSLAVLEDGTTVEISMIGRDGIAGMPAIVGPRTNQFWMRVCVGGSVGKLDADVLTDVFNKNRRVQKLLLHSYNSLVTQISQRSVCNVRHSVMQRFCCWLLMAQDRVGIENMPLTQELIASKLGARRAGITVAARGLYDRKAIEYKRGLLHIKNRSLIEQEACECYSILKSQDTLSGRWSVDPWYSHDSSSQAPATALTRRVVAT